MTVYGRGGHASMPQACVDPVVLAASIVLRLQTIVSREVEPGEPAVLTVGSVTAGTKANIIADRAELQINIRTYSEATRSTILAAIRRIVTAECAASNSPREPEFEMFDQAPLTVNDPEVTATVTEAFTEVLGADRVIEPPRILGSEDFSDIANGVGAPYTFWLFGGADPTLFSGAEGSIPLGSSRQPLTALCAGHPADPGHRHGRPGGRGPVLAGTVATALIHRSPGVFVMFTRRTVGSATSCRESSWKSG